MNKLQLLLFGFIAGCIITIATCLMIWQMSIKPIPNTSGVYLGRIQELVKQGIENEKQKKKLRSEIAQLNTVISYRDSLLGIKQKQDEKIYYNILHLSADSAISLAKYYLSR